MGYWTNTAYIVHSDSHAVASCLREIIETEGMRAIPRPSERERLQYEPMQYATGARNNLWGMAIFPGAPGWTVIKSAPLELLAERPSPDGSMRLVTLCDRLKAQGGLLNVYDGSSGILLEADGNGRFVLSGFAPDSAANPDPMFFHGAPLSLDHLQVSFQILPLQPVAKECTREYDFSPGQPILDSEELARKLEVLLGGANADFCSNITSVQTLVCHKPLEAIGGTDLYFEWPPRDRDEPARRNWATNHSPK